MPTKLRKHFSLGMVLSALLLFSEVGHAADRLVLDQATIVAEVDQPSFVQYGIEEVANYLKEVTGHDVTGVTSLNVAKGTRIVVGTKMAGEVLGQDFPKDQLGDEGYLLKAVTRDGVQSLIVAGA